MNLLLRSPILVQKSAVPHLKEQRWDRTFLGNYISWLLTALIIMPLAAGCSPNANAEIISPQLGTIEVAKAAGAQIVAAPTEAPPTLAELSDEQIYAGLPEAVAAAIPNADLAHAQQLALTSGCSGCHSLDPTVQQPGPSWASVGDQSVARAQAAGDAGPAAYLYQSISAPNAYLVPSYAGGIMPQTFNELLSDQDFADLIAYLLAQRTP